MSAYQPYFVAYCAMRRQSPEAVRASRGWQWQFIRWIGRRWAAWRAEAGVGGSLHPEHHVAFAEWLR